MERINNQFDRLFDIIPGAIFGLLSVGIGVLCDFISFLFIPDYNIFNNLASELGLGPGGIYFRVGLIISGIIAVPFDIYLGRALRKERVNDKTVNFAVAISIISCLSMSLTGVFPMIKTQRLIFIIHGIFAGISWIGGLLYSVLFGYLMLKDENFSNNLAYLSFIEAGLFLLVFIIFLPFTEWFMIFGIILSTTIVASYMLYKKL